RVQRVAFELAHPHRILVDVGQEPAGRLAVEADRRHEHVALLDPARPLLRVVLAPVVPLLRRRVGLQPRAWREPLDGHEAALSKRRWSARSEGLLAAEPGFTPGEAELDEDAEARTRSPGPTRPRGPGVGPRLNGDNLSIVMRGGSAAGPARRGASTPPARPGRGRRPGGPGRCPTAASAAADGRPRARRWRSASRPG